ncbi:hypothetical protein VULLAG_LOCUS1504 [Vulpes lagopus]
MLSKCVGTLGPQAGGRLGRQATAGPGPASWTGAFPSPTPGAHCPQLKYDVPNCPGAGGMGLDDRPLPLPLFALPCPPHLEAPSLFSMSEPPSSHVAGDLGP